jgi:hypothetical protein
MANRMLRRKQNKAPSGKEAEELVKARSGRSALRSGASRYAALLRPAQLLLSCESVLAFWQLTR